MTSTAPVTAQAVAEVEVTVPATSANLGAGYDSFGIALDIRDTVRARLHDAPVDPSDCVRITGEGADEVPTGQDHLILRVMREVLAARGVETADRISLECENVIAHSRGMGSSAAAVVAGIAIADAASAFAGLPAPSPEEKLAWATHFEGHPDNAAPAIFGGVTVSYSDSHGQARSVSVPVAEDVSAVLIVPDERLDTSVARSLLPETVPHADAAANAAIAGLFVYAIGHDPGLLFDATVDRLHQNYRRPAMTAALERVDALRAAGLAAVVSGAGPTVLVLGSDDDLAAQVGAVLTGDAARIVPAAIAETGVEVMTTDCRLRA